MDKAVLHSPQSTTHLTTLFFRFLPHRHTNFSPFLTKPNRTTPDLNLYLIYFWYDDQGCAILIKVIEIKYIIKTKWC